MNNVRWSQAEFVLTDGKAWGRESGLGVVGKRIRFTVGKADMGSVVWFLDSGPFYPLTQVRRFGAVATRRRAMDLVEQWGVYDVLSYPIMGHA